MKVVILAGGLDARMSDETATRFLISGTPVHRSAFSGNEFRISVTRERAHRIVQDTFRPGTFSGLGRGQRNFVAERIGTFFEHGL